jgi:hypothetical protein
MAQARLAQQPEALPKAWKSIAERYAQPARPRNRRREFRYTLPHGASTLLRFAPTTETVTAEIRNVSPRGVALLMDQSVPPGTYVSFPFAGARIFAQVCHCRLTRVGFMVGARVTDVLGANGDVGNKLKL